MPPVEPVTPDGQTVLEAQSVVRHYVLRRGTSRRPALKVRAVDGVSLSLASGEALGIVGESGCGKSTLARLLVRLESPTHGNVLFHGRDVHQAKGAELADLRRKVQIVFQDPYTSLNPRMSAGDIIGEGIDVHPEVRTRVHRTKRIGELLDLVGLRPEHAARYPHQFSGGQRQRIGIARALVLDPEVLILDEPVSALDVSVQAQVINLLQELRSRLGLAYILISHDLSVVGHTCDRVAVMYLGKIVEIGTSRSIFEHASHPYTQALLSAVPTADPRKRGHRQRIVLQGDLPDASNPPSGCSFRTRCWKAQDLCAQVEPPLVAHGSSGVLSACHFAEESPAPPAAPGLAHASQ